MGSPGRQKIIRLNVGSLDFNRYDLILMGISLDSNNTIEHFLSSKVGFVSRDIDIIKSSVLYYSGGFSGNG